MARGVARQVGKVLEYLHGLEIVHRDLKLENILVGREGRLKLIDYGFSRQLPRETFMLYDFCGTPHYIAP
jgi:serine/threonine protein kinase